MHVAVPVASGRLRNIVNGLQGELRLPGRREVAQNALAGLVVGIVALPLAIALAVAVGVPPAAGLYTAIFAGATAAIFGGSNFNITGPTAALVPILAHVVLQHGAAALPMAGLMAGVLLLVMGALRFGRLMRFMPELVIVGFTGGIALSIAFGQLNSFLGVTGTDGSAEHFHEKLLDTIHHLNTVGLTTPLIGLATIAILVAWPKLRVGRVSLRRIPGPLVATVAVTAVTWGFGIDSTTVAGRYGELPAGLPTPSLNFFDAGLFFALLPAAASIAVLGAIESLLCAVVADGMSSVDVRYHPDRELRGQGLANIVAPLMAGIPATAAIARTATGVRNGATSRLTGVFHALTVLIATLALGGLAGHIPLAVLAAVLLVVAWNIAEVPKLLRLVRSAPRSDAAILLSVLVITLFLDLTYAIALGVGISMVLLIRRLVSLPAARELLPDESGLIRQVTPELSQLIQSRPDILFFSAQGLLSFHSAAAFEFELNHDRLHDPLILRMKDVHHVDATGLLTLEAVIHHRQKHGGRVLLTAVHPSVLAAMERFGLMETLGRENLFAHTRDAIASIDRPSGHEPHPHRPEPHISAAG